MIDVLIFNIDKFFYSDAITEETLAAVRNYTKKIEYLVHIKKGTQLNKIIELATDVKLTRRKKFAIGILRNCARNASFLQHIK